MAGNIFVRTIVDRLMPHLGMPASEVEALVAIPPNPKMGDYSVPCFAPAKVLQRPPQALASELAVHIGPDEFIDRAQAAGPYLNFFVNKARFARDVLQTIRTQGDRFGNCDMGQGKAVCIDFSSPNIAKHLAVHHLQSTMIGNALYRIFQALGYRCVGINHLGDWGTQFGQLIVAYKRWGSPELLEQDGITNLNQLYVRFHAECEQMGSLTRFWKRTNA